MTEISQHFISVCPITRSQGAVYPIEVYYRDGDLFTNSAADDSCRKYAFSHAVNGSVTIE